MLLKPNLTYHERNNNKNTFSNTFSPQLILLHKPGLTQVRLPKRKLRFSVTDLLRIQTRQLNPGLAFFLSYVACNRYKVNIIIVLIAIMGSGFENGISLLQHNIWSLLDILKNRICETVIVLCFYLLYCIMQNENKMGLPLLQIYFKIQIMKLHGNVRLNAIKIILT